jgi:hypothetical protein
VPGLTNHPRRNHSSIHLIGVITQDRLYGQVSLTFFLRVTKLFISGDPVGLYRSVSTFLDSVNSIYDTNSRRQTMILLAYNAPGSSQDAAPDRTMRSRRFFDDREHGR